MRTGPIISLILSIIVGVVAVFFGRSWLDSEADAALPPPPAEVIVEKVETTPVVVARERVERGDLLSNASLELVEWPNAFLPEGVLTNTDLLVGPDGSFPFALGVIVPGELIVSEKLSMRVPRDTLATLIEPGYRAVSIEVDDATGVSGFVLPDTRVDVILSRELVSSNGAVNFRPETLMRDIRVLAVDQSFASDLEGASLARTVTLQVNTTQAGQLIASSDIGRLGLALRSKDEPTLAAPVRRPVARRSAPRRTTASVRIIEGEEEQTVTAPVAAPTER